MALDISVYDCTLENGFRVYVPLESTRRLFQEVALVLKYRGLDDSETVAIKSTEAH